MALSDCPECWNTPCTCGYMYRNWSPDKKQELIDAINSSNMEQKFETSPKCKILKDITNDDYEHLAWIFGRMLAVHNESANFDYMIKFADILKKMCPQKDI